MSAAAFLSALFVGVALHYRKIVQNEFYGYPDEWFPSVSATIGDRYPERSFFMIFIAITSGMASLYICAAPLERVADLCRPSVCARRLVVSPDAEARIEAPRLRRLDGPPAYPYLRWLDLHHLDG